MGWLVRCMLPMEVSSSTLYSAVLWLATNDFIVSASLRASSSSVNLSAIVIEVESQFDDLNTKVIIEASSQMNCTVCVCVCVCNGIVIM